MIVLLLLNRFVSRKKEFVLNCFSLSFPQVHVERKRGFVPVDERMRVLDFKGDPVSSIMCL